MRTTLAHEAGHGLLHAYLFALDKSPSISSMPTVTLTTRFFAGMSMGRNGKTGPAMAVGGNSGEPGDGRALMSQGIGAGGGKTLPACRAVPLAQ